MGLAIAKKDINAKIKVRVRNKGVVCGKTRN
jgi:hypothetical protein